MTAATATGAIRLCARVVVNACVALSYPRLMESRLDGCCSPYARLGARSACRPSRLRTSSFSLRPSLRLWLRPSLRSCLHRLIGSDALDRRFQRGLRAQRFADISTHSPGPNSKSNRGDRIVLESPLCAPLALGAIAIAAALAPQRFAGSTAPIALGATAIAPAPARQRLFSKRPRAWRLA